MNDIMETDRGRVPWGEGGGENSSQNIEIFRNTRMYEMTNQKISETKIKENYKVNENDNSKEDDKDKMFYTIEIFLNEQKIIAMFSLQNMRKQTKKTFLIVCIYEWIMELEKK